MSHVPLSTCVLTLLSLCLPLPDLSVYMFTCLRTLLPSVSLSPALSILLLLSTCLRTLLSLYLPVSDPPVPSTTCIRTLLSLCLLVPGPSCPLYIYLSLDPPVPLSTCLLSPLSTCLWSLLSPLCRCPRLMCPGPVRLAGGFGEENILVCAPHTYPPHSCRNMEQVGGLERQPHREYTGRYKERHTTVYTFYRKICIKAH